MLNFIFRIILTIGVLAYLKKKNVTSLPLFIIVLFILDFSDSIIFAPSDFDTYKYHKNDKVVDLLTYIYFYILFNNLFDDVTKKILIGFILLRSIGVIAFYATGNTKYIQYFPDFINSTLIVYAIYQYFSLTTQSYYIMIIISMIIKILIERKMHNKVYH